MQQILAAKSCPYPHLVDAHCGVATQDFGRKKCIQSSLGLSLWKCRHSFCGQQICDFCKPKCIDPVKGCGCAGGDPSASAWQARQAKRPCHDRRGPVKGEPSCPCPCPCPCPPPLALRPPHLTPTPIFPTSPPLSAFPHSPLPIE